MKRIPTALLFGIGLAASVLAIAVPVHAALGEPADSAAEKEAALSAKQVSKTAPSGYTVRESVFDSYTLREYIAPSGIVFAVAWVGLVIPDLTPLLGSYAGEYADALRELQREPGSRYRRITADRVVVETWGHMRHLQGRAYVLTLIPPGVGIDEIR